MSLPNLSSLNVHVAPREARRLLKGDVRVGDGVYCLDTQDATNPCHSFVVLKRRAIVATDDEFAEAQDFFVTQVDYPPPFMGHPILRKQCTFGTVQYARYKLISERARWPTLVSRVIEATQAFAAELGIEHPEEYDAVHGNYYQCENAGVSKHADDEPQLVPDAPIFSYTFLEHDNNAGARPFDIMVKTNGAEGVEGTGRVARIVLESGDLLVMAGQMQRHFQHALPKPGSAVEGGLAPRLNFTVRRFKPPQPKKRGREAS
jgi:alkylated DNA repair dioxygenase AlkB